MYSCTSNGALRVTHLDKTESTPSQTAVLPMRLCDWRLSHDEKTFAYGGDEVELSVWDTERAFCSATTPTTTEPSEPAQKKRKRDELLPSEIWRAKNVRPCLQPDPVQRFAVLIHRRPFSAQVANDSLSLRRPVYNTCLTHLNPSPSTSTSQQSHHIATGTQFGSVRRYDTRSARRPVADWNGVAKMGGIRAVAKGLNEQFVQFFFYVDSMVPSILTCFYCRQSELFVADQGCNLFSLDLRNGSVVYGYKGNAEHCPHLIIFSLFSN